MLSLEQATQALNELAARPGATYSQVEAIVSQVNAASSTANGVLYSGKVLNANGSTVSAEFIANGIAASSGGSFSTINGTDRGQLLFTSSSPANQALISALKTVAVNEDPSLAGSALDNAVNAKINGDPVNGLNLLAPAKGERFAFRAHVVKAGRTLTVCEARAFAQTDGSESLIATMTGTLMALTPRG